MPPPNTSWPLHSTLPVRKINIRDQENTTEWFMTSCRYGCDTTVAKLGQVPLRDLLHPITVEIQGPGEGD